ncbi:MAG TPA: TetR/AcrR family transcriptional regulator [Acidimicrobiales bacterium]|nr:TetR/AcrR family transcriptional regulator [Acidimicrobiales bacterium]
MDAAMEVFAEKGYASTTVEDIARAAGASAATFYLHFKRKIDVLKESVEEEYRRVSFLSEPLWSAGRPHTRETLRAWAADLFDYWQELRVPHQVLGQAVLIEPELKTLQTQRLTEGIEYWEAFLGELGASPGPRLRAEAALLNAQFFGLFEIWIVSQVPLDKDMLVELVTDSLWLRVKSIRAPRRSLVAGS